MGLLMMNPMNPMMNRQMIMFLDFLLMTLQKRLSELGDYVVIGTSSDMIVVVHRGISDIATIHTLPNRSYFVQMGDTLYDLFDMADLEGLLVDIARKLR